MNKKKTKLTPFKEPYLMQTDEFCELYNLDLKVVLRRINGTWRHADALIIPTSLGNTKIPTIKRALTLINMKWKDEEIEKRLDISQEILNEIKNLDEYIKEIVLSSPHYFFLDIDNIDITRIFDINKCLKRA